MTQRAMLAVLALVLALATGGRAAEPTVQDGIVYGHVGDVELKLNLATPPLAVGVRAPLIVLIHGGGWQTGHRNAYNGEIREAARRGFAAATISHRLTAEKDESGKPLHPWPAAIHDCKAAIRFLKTHADRFQIDPQRIGATGGSSGGHLALLLGFTGPDDGLEGDVAMPESDLEPVTDTTIHAVVNTSGPTDLVLCYEAPIVTPYLDDLLGPLAQNRPRYVEASPLTYLPTKTPPVLTIHGKLDDVVPVEHAHLLDERMKGEGLSHEYLELTDEKHILTREGNREHWDALWGFFERVLQP